MWPWGHLAFGYVCVSLLARLVARRPPTGREAVAVLVATQLPDLVDKPLGWGLELYATGYGAAHSVLVAGPLLLLVVAYGLRARSTPPLAFAVAYATHLGGDVAAAVLHGNPDPLGRVLWPVADLPTYETDLGLTARALHYLRGFGAELAEPGALLFAAAYASVFVAVGALWLYDGAPGPDFLRAALGRTSRP